METIKVSPDAMSGLFLAREEIVYLKLLLLLNRYEEERHQLPYEDVFVNYGKELGGKAVGEIAGVTLARWLRPFVEESSPQTFWIGLTVPHDIRFINHEDFWGTTYLSKRAAKDEAYCMDLHSSYHIGETIPRSERSLLLAQRLERTKRMFKALQQEYQETNPLNGKSPSEITELIMEDYKLLIIADLAQSILPEASDATSSISKDTVTEQLDFFSSFARGLYHKKWGDIDEAVVALTEARESHRQANREWVFKLSREYSSWWNEFDEVIQGSHFYWHDYVEYHETLFQNLTPSPLQRLSPEETPSFHLGECYMEKGEEERKKGHLPKAVESFRKAINYLEESQNFARGGMLLSNDLLQDPIIRSLYFWLASIYALRTREFDRSPYVEKDIGRCSLELGKIETVKATGGKPDPGEIHGWQDLDRRGAAKQALGETKTRLEQSFRFYENLSDLDKHRLAKAYDFGDNLDDYRTAIDQVTTFFEVFLKNEFREKILNIQKTYPKAMAGTETEKFSIGVFLYSVEKLIFKTNFFLLHRIDREIWEEIFKRSKEVNDKYRIPYHHGHETSETKKQKRDWEKVRSILMGTGSQDGLIQLLLDHKRDLDAGEVTVVPK